MSLALDFTGELPANRVTNETYQVSQATMTTPVIFLKQNFFFGRNLTINFTPSSGGPTRQLTLGTDFYLIGTWSGIATSVGGVYAGLFIVNKSLIGEWGITYQALGGNAILDTSNALAYFSSPTNLDKPTNSQVQPLPQYGAIATNLDLMAAQTRFAAVVMRYNYYKNPYGTDFTYLYGSTGQPGGGTDPGAGGGIPPGGTVTVPLSSVTGISDLGKSLISKSTQAEMQAVLGILGGTGSGGGPISITTDLIIDATPTGKLLMKAASPAAVKTTLGITANDVSGLGTAAQQPASAFATAAQGAKADSALQVLPIASGLTLGGVKVGAGFTQSGDGTIAVTPASVGALASSAVTPTGLSVISAASTSAVISALGLGTIATRSATDYVFASQVGAPSGLATLGSDGKLTSSQIPASLVGGLNYQGTWDASTNTPALASGAGTKGHYYVVSVSGNVTVNGINQWAVGDMIAFNGVSWQRIHGASTEVTSVAGRSGAVVLTSTDLGDVTTFGRSLMTSASAATAKSYLGITVADVSGLANTATTNASTIGVNLLTATTQATAQSVLGLGSAATKLISDFVGTSSLGVANGVATLGSDGKLNPLQIPSSLLGALNYQGTWNPATNTPALASGVGTKGHYYKVTSDATSASLNGITQWYAGDLVVFDGSAWSKIDGNSSEVISVAGRTGAVTLASTDITDSSSLGRQLLTASTTAAAQSILGVSGGAGITITVTGNSTVGSVLTATLPAGYVAASWQWSRKDAQNNLYPIAGATSATYTIVSADQGFSLIPTAVNLSYIGQTGVAVAAVGGAVSPVITVAPTIVSALVGSPLVFTSATVTGNPTPTVTYDVLSGSTVLAANTTSGTYVVKATDTNLTVRATAYNSAGSTTASSTSVAPVENIPGSIVIDGVGTLMTQDGTIVFTMPTAPAFTPGEVVLDGAGSIVTQDGTLIFTNGATNSFTPGEVVLDGAGTVTTQDGTVIYTDGAQQQTGLTLTVDGSAMVVDGMTVTIV